MFHDYYPTNNQDCLLCIVYYLLLILNNQTFYLLDFLENLFNNGGDVKKYLAPMDFGLGDIPVLNLDGKSAKLYRNGGFIEVVDTNGLYRIYSGGVFVGIGVVTDGVLKPKRTI